MIEANIILEEIGYTRVDSLINPNLYVDKEKLNFVKSIIKQRTLFLKPLSYILKKVNFYGLEFFVDSSVLVPRQETEELVNLLLTREKNDTIFLDLASGSGIIGISILMNLSNSYVYFNDISAIACDIIERNVNRYNLQERATIIQSSFDNIEKDIIDKVETVVSNPPYVSFGEIELLNDEAYYEPTNAIFAKDPISIYKTIIQTYRGKAIYFEINPKHSTFLKQFGRVIKDINNKDRILVVKTTK